jgi:hypothetical protein
MKRVVVFLYVFFLFLVSNAHSIESDEWDLMQINGLYYVCNQKWRYRVESYKNELFLVAENLDSWRLDEDLSEIFKPGDEGRYYLEKDISKPYIITDKNVRFYVTNQEIINSLIGPEKIEAEKKAVNNITRPAKGKKAEETATGINRELQEFELGLTHEYKSTKNPKAKGIIFSIKYPMSWKAEPGNRPNVVQKFMKNSGDGLESASIVVKYVGKNKTDIDTALDLEKIRDDLPNSAIYLEGSSIHLDGCPGLQIRFIDTLEQMGVKIKIFMDVYNIYYDGKIIVINCMTANPADFQQDEIIRHHQKHEKLFRLMANSLVIHSQYAKSKVSDPIRNTDQAKTTFEKVRESANRCIFEKKGTYIKCYMRATPKKCEKLMTDWLASRGDNKMESLIKLRICFSTCDDASIFSRMLGECSTN